MEEYLRDSLSVGGKVTNLKAKITYSSTSTQKLIIMSLTLKLMDHLKATYLNKWMWG
ncbi:MAG: hypothetical protein ACRCUP_07205 [Mycoplasmatales bacterium]